MNNATNPTQAPRALTPPTRSFAVGRWVALMCDYGIDGGAPSISLVDGAVYWTVAFVDLDLSIAVSIDEDEAVEAVEVFGLGARRWNRSNLNNAIGAFNANNCEIPDVADLILAVDQMAAEKGWW